MLSCFCHDTTFTNKLDNQILQVLLTMARKLDFASAESLRLLLFDPGGGVFFNDYKKNESHPELVALTQLEADGSRRRNVLAPVTAAGCRELQGLSLSLVQAGHTGL